MAWFFRIVFGLLGLCLLIWLAEQVKNLLSPRQRCPAVVKQRRQQVFPVSMGFKRRDRNQYLMEFFLPRQQRTVTFEVSQSVYESSPTGTGGWLSWRGSRFLGWEPQGGPGQASGGTEQA